jgi:electron transfer flavoprotein alpha subunit
MGMDYSYLEQLMGGSAEQPSGDTSGGAAGGIWVVSLAGALDDAILRLVGKARVVADALGSYVYLLLAGECSSADAQSAIQAGADRVLLVTGLPSHNDLVEFFRPRAPRAILFSSTRLGRTLGPGLAQALGGGLAGCTVDLAVDPILQRISAHQPILDDAARQVVTILADPAIVVVDCQALPPAFSEPWRRGAVEDTGIRWTVAPELAEVELPVVSLTLANAPVVIAAGRGLRDAEGFALAERLAQALGGMVAGDVGALDAGWIGEEQLVDLTGQPVAPRLYVALGISGDSGHLMALEKAATIVAVQPDSTAPIVAIADWNILADPVEFVCVLLSKLSA